LKILHGCFIVLFNLFLLCACAGTYQKPSVSPFKDQNKPRAYRPNPTENGKQTDRPLRITRTDQNKGETAVKKSGESDHVPYSNAKIESILDESLDFCGISQDFWQKGELEKALEALDQAYRLILMVKYSEDKPELMQQKEDLRFMISKRILEIYASRHTVVNGNYDPIPMIMNKRIQKEINSFTTGVEKKFFIKSYIRSGKYRAKILVALKEAGIPEELSWLPLIESGFKVKALSKARALGLWQFIPSTGYKYGLKRNKYIDERIDPEKSTKAAVAYLKALHQIFGDWTTVLAAYNCGEGRVLRTIRSQNINYLDNFWDLYQKLPRETARYVPRFMATLHILKNPEKYGFDSIKTDFPLKYKTVKINKQVHLGKVEQAMGLRKNVLIDLNPELRYGILPANPYQLKIPPGYGKKILAKINRMPVSSLPRPAYTYHRVRRGETLSTISMKYRSSVRRIMRANNLRQSNYIVTGKKLKIPLSGSYVPKTASTRRKKSTHVVRRGDSLWIIAKRYSTTTKQIQKLNKLSSARLKIGQVLKIPGYYTRSTPKGGLNRYVVKRGDTPFTIAKNHNMPLNSFLNMNNLTRRSKIFPGQTLHIK